MWSTQKNGRCNKQLNIHFISYPIIMFIKYQDKLYDIDNAISVDWPFMVEKKAWSDLNLSWSVYIVKFQHPHDNESIEYFEVYSQTNTDLFYKIDKYISLWQEKPEWYVKETLEFDDNISSML